MKNYKKISIKNFIKCFGAKKKEFNKNILKYIKKNNFEYINTSKTESEKIFKEIIERINKKQFSKSGKNRFLDWEDGWKQNYINFKKSNYDTEELIPKYIHGNRPIRWKQKFIISKAPLLEWRFSNVFRNWLFKKYFNKVKNVYDFGTGTACHLVLMAKIFPRKRLVGLDWSRYSQKIIKLLKKKKKLNIKGYNFDFFKINNKIKIESDSGVLTYGALEQVGNNFKNFINYLIENRPEICVHVECEDSFYDKNKYIDYLGYKYHMQRGYLTGFIKFLRDLEKKNIIKILNIKRLYFGSYYQEVYNYIVWKIVK